MPAGPFRPIANMLAFSVRPGYRRSRPPARPKLDPFTGIIDGILAEDEGRPKKQRNTSKRIFERLRAHAHVDFCEALAEIAGGLAPFAGERSDSARCARSPGETLSRPTAGLLHLG